MKIQVRKTKKGVLRVQYWTRKQSFKIAANSPHKPFRWSFNTIAPVYYTNFIVLPFPSNQEKNFLFNLIQDDSDTWIYTAALLSHRTKLFFVQKAIVGTRKARI